MVDANANTVIQVVTDQLVQDQNFFPIFTAVEKHDRISFFPRLLPLFPGAVVECYSVIPGFRTTVLRTLVFWARLVTRRHADLFARLARPYEDVFLASLATHNRCAHLALLWAT